MNSETESNLKRLIADTMNVELSNIWVFLNKCDDPKASQHFVSDTHKQFQELDRTLPEGQAIPINAKIPSLVMKYRKLVEETKQDKVDFQRLARYNPSAMRSVYSLLNPIDLIRDPSHKEILKMFLGDAWQQEDYDDLSAKQIERKLEISLRGRHVYIHLMSHIKSLTRVNLDRTSTLPHPSFIITA